MVTVYCSHQVNLLMFRKCRAQLSKTNIQKLCVELTKMFPVTGKSSSFSLRTSAILTHGIMMMFKFKIDLVRSDLTRLGSSIRTGRGKLLVWTVMLGLSGSFCFSGKSAAQPGQGEAGLIDQKPGAAKQVDLEVAINPGDLEVVLDIPELSQSELEARRRAVTLVEVDNPQLAPQDDWATPTEEDLPRVTLEMLGSEGLLPGVELGSVLQEEGEVSAMMPPPPVRPSSASDPHVEVTPTVQEEKKRKSPRQPAEDLNPPDIVVDPPAVEAETEAPVQRKRRSSRLADLSMEENAVIQPPPAPEDLPDSFELPEVTAKPPKKKKRKLGRICVDESTQLSIDTIKAQMADYQDLLREEQLPAPDKQHGGLQGPGRALKGVLASFWEEEMAANMRTARDNLEWPEEVVVEEDLPEANPELNPSLDLLQIPDDVSEIRAHGAPETIGEANLSSTETGQVSTVTNNILQDLELPPEVQLQGGEDLAVAPVQDPEVVPASPLRVPQQDDGPALPLSPLLAAQLDLLARPDDSVVSSSLLDQLEPGQAWDFHSFVENVGPVQPTRRDVAKIFRSLLVLEKKEELEMNQEEGEEGFYATITLTKM